MKKVLMAGMLLAASSAHAEFKADIAAVTQYYFRGLEQTSGVAGQGGLSWSGEYDTLHPYAGLWASNLDEVHGLGQVETNAFGGLLMQWHDFNFDVGARYYFFPDADEPSDVDNVEPYAGIAIGPIAMKAHYSYDYYGSDLDSWYVQAAVTLPMPMVDALLLHLDVGYTFGEAQDQFTGGAYDDYAASLIYQLPWWAINLTASYVVTKAPGESDRIIGAISKSFEF